MIKISVPATSANLGPGFDSLGFSLNLYLTIEATDSTNWKIEHNLGAEIPDDQNNLLVQTALSVSKKIKPQQIKMNSQIPLARGLGSSSSVIVAGLALGMRLAGIEIDLDDLINRAVKIEGHPDNVIPAVVGSVVIASYLEEQVYYVTLPNFPPCSIFAFIPNVELKTVASREVLPTTLAFAQAIKASANANVLVAALSERNLRLAGKMMEQDCFHEPYRKKLIPKFDSIKELASQYDAYATYISGAGPAVISLLPIEKEAEFAKAVQQFDYLGEIKILAPEIKGLKIV